ncbi:hypothetical protein CBR_g37664 [Chara braunii]|uniref:ZIP family transporter n=1 Tax=Chara braunii TaxID=69332 RepID=A0A388LNG6_CHABU|nr:hypothetical protein CBR_g37664 [Chara braunii]|eukprot:GBG83867.1 hypothetical protein CBR_g37664 [Chara braunii]
MDGDGGYGVRELAMVMGISRRVLHGSQATEHEDVGVDVGHGQEEGSSTDHNSSRDLRIAAMFIIMSASTLGFLIPVILTKWKRIQFSLESRVLLVGKAFSAGVVVATALVHMFPEALSSFESDRLAEHPWQKFPWAGATTTLAALVTHVFDFMATTHIQRKHGMKLEEVTSSTALTASGAGAMLAVTAMGKTPGAEGKGDVVVDCHEHQHQNCEKLTRNIVVAEILEYGIASHSVLIGITLGVLTDRSEIRPLLIALVFHQFFEGIALGACGVQARFKNLSLVVMCLFFSLSTASGILIGILISKSYEEESTAALLVHGFFDSFSAGILLYNGLVSLIANDFFSDRMKADHILQVMAYIALFAGGTAMSVIGMWA